jgi:hypothetical protein
LTNYFGKGGQLTVDLERGHRVSVREDQKNTDEFIVDWQNHYTVSEETNGIPSRMQINLAPGTYRYTASVPDVGTVNRTIDVAAGQVIGLGFYGGSPTEVVHNHSQSHGDNTKHTDVSYDFKELLVAQEDMTAQAR